MTYGCHFRARRRIRMTSPRKLAANRRNALQSTGPRTVGGKARSARNHPLVHGLLSRAALLPTEDRREFERVAQGFREDRPPVGAREHFLLDVMISNAWRWRR